MSSLGLRTHRLSSGHRLEQRDEAEQRGALARDAQPGARRQRGNVLVVDAALAAEGGGGGRARVLVRAEQPARALVLGLHTRAISASARCGRGKTQSENVSSTVSKLPSANSSRSTSICRSASRPRSGLRAAAAAASASMPSLRSLATSDSQRAASYSGRLRPVPTPTSSTRPPQRATASARSAESPSASAAAPPSSLS